MQDLSDRLWVSLYRISWAIVRKMPEGWARWLFTVIADTLWRREGKGVQQLEANLVRVIGPDQPGARLRQLSRASMRSYLRYWLEVFRLPDMPAEQIMAGTRMHGGLDEVALGLLAAGRGVIFALPHMGNYEHAGAWIIRRGAGSFTTVAERLKPERVYDQFLAFREHLGMEVLPHTGGADPFAQLARRLREGRLVCLVCDRDLTARGVEVEFFGERARMAAGPAALAVETGAALMPVALWFQDEDWAVKIYPEIPVPPDGSRQDKILAMSQQMAAAFEDGISAHPQDWHMLQKVFTVDLDPERLVQPDVAAPDQSAR